MINTHTCCRKAMFRSSVVSNDAIRPRYFRLRLQLDETGSEAFAGANPGQFAEIDVSKLSLPTKDNIPEDMIDLSDRQVILRRPFSFSDIRSVEGIRGAIMIEMIYAVIGPGTLRMTTLRPGDEVNVIGPLGNGFSGWEGKRLAILIAGGMGAPPLQHLAAHLRRICPETEVVMFAGARSIDDLPFTIAPDESAVELSEIDIEAHICTDDGSVGFAGFVTGCAAKWLENRSFVASETAIYSCGPEVMLSAVASLGRANDIECQVSMERMMGCGIGLCQSCAVEVKAGGDETAYKLCCKDGPVFDSKDVCFSV